MFKKALFTTILLLSLVSFSFADQIIEALQSQLEATYSQDEGDQMDWITTEEGLQYRIIQAGDGNIAKKGDNVSVHYTGTFLDGRKFDSSVDRGTPFEFQLGAGMVIKGWDIGVAGMAIGEKRELQIPSNLAYGSRGAAGGTIPPNTDLLFTVELLGIK
ncbi:MAG: FKBP-type peptidyl-prolyl cis-trans isomerase [Candidatus Cloacimonetes bacterium]|nr:FKBP-type peptidyl-prolyl cis-trans isomerase [Candidatus Cloacimonadota bacterium]